MNFSSNRIQYGCHYRLFQRYYYSVELEKNNQLQKLLCLNHQNRKTNFRNNNNLKGRRLVKL